MVSAPQPETTMCRPPAESAALPAYESQPMAPPETTQTPPAAATLPAISAIALP